MNTSPIPEIVLIAMVKPVTDIGQLSKQNVSDLNKFIKSGVLAKGKGGAFPKEKTVYALIGHDFKASRETMVREMLSLS